jgi:hypothetical protein
MITLITEQHFRFNSTVLLPYVGQAQISENGELNVDDLMIAEALVAANVGFSFKETSKKSDVETTELEEIKKKSEDNEIGKQDADELGQTPVDSTTLNKVESTVTEEETIEALSLKEQIEAMSLEEMRRLAEEAKLPKNKWNIKGEKALRTYLINELIG